MTKKELEKCLMIACETLAKMDEMCAMCGAMDDKDTLDPKGWMKDIVSEMKRRCEYERK